MPAAAVIPAPIAYIKVVAVKKLVVGCCGLLNSVPFGTRFSSYFFSRHIGALNRVFILFGTFTVRKLECS